MMKQSMLIWLVLVMHGQAVAGVLVGPINDDFVSATDLNGASGTVTGSNELASSEDGEPDFLQNQASVWWRWTAPLDGVAVFDTQGSVLEDTVLGVYQGESLETLTVVAENVDADAGSGDFWSRVGFPCVAGQVYWIAVGGFNGETGELRLNWEASERIVPPGFDLPVMVYNLRATETWTGPEELDDDESDQFFRWGRFKQVSNAIVVRGRGTGSFIDGEGREHNSMAIFTLVRERFGGFTFRYFTVDRYSSWDVIEGRATGEGLQTRLLRLNGKKTGVTAEWKLFAEREIESSIDLEGSARATLSAPFRGAQALWFAKRVQGSKVSFVDASEYQEDFAEPGFPTFALRYQVKSDLKFNSKRTAAVKDLDLDAAVQALADQLSAEGWENFD